MMTLVNLFGRCCLVLGMLAIAPALQAQDNPFAPAITVNGRIITNYELMQRVIFISLLQPGADATTDARRSLIDDRLRLYAAEQLGVEISEADVVAGMESFAARVNLPLEEFLKALAPRGVAAETLRDFVRSGLIWREAVRMKYLPSTRVTEAQIDRAIVAGKAAGGELKLLLAEIAIPTGGVVDAMTLAERIRNDVKSSPGFSAAARLNSKSPTAIRGGQLDWLLAADLPPAIAAAVAELEIGEMTQPIAMPGSVMLYYMRDKSLTQGEAIGPMALDYLRLIVAPGTDTDRMRADVDRCEDLMPLARDLPEEAMVREIVPEGAVGGEYGAALRGLDTGETTVITTAAGQTALVMLCSRQPLTEVAPSRDDIRAQLLNQKMALRAQSYLEELRAEALIIEN